MDFQKFLINSQRTEENSVQENSRRMYESSIRTYERTMSNAFPEIEIYPITENLMRVFIEFSKDVLHRTCQTLLNYIASFTFYFNKNNLEDLTKTPSFKKYRKGLSKQMKKQKVPNRKLPILPEDLQNFFDKTNFKDIKETTGMFALSIMFFGFFRASEFTSLKYKNLRIFEGNLIVHLDFSKTDVTGNGVDVTIAPTEHDYDPQKLLRIINEGLDYDEERPLWVWHQDTLRKFLRDLLIRCEYPHPEAYSLHSCRRGGAHAASNAGIQDSVIKKHGRWLSEIYQIYTQVDEYNAGIAITRVI